MQLIAILIVALPMVSAGLTLAAGAGGRNIVSRISILALVLTFALASLQLWREIAGETPAGSQDIFGWHAFLSDPLGALMAWVVAGIALIVHIFSRRYMAEEVAYARFFVLLNLMTATLLALVQANDLILLVVAWHLVGVLLYLLLSFDLSSREAFRHASWTLITFRIGDLPLVLAAVLLYHAYGTWSLQDIFAAMATDPAPAGGSSARRCRRPLVS